MRARLGAAFHAPPELPRNVCPLPPPLLAAWAQASARLPAAQPPLRPWGGESRLAWWRKWWILVRSSAPPRPGLESNLWMCWRCWG